MYQYDATLAGGNSPWAKILPPDSSSSETKVFPLVHSSTAEPIDDKKSERSEINKEEEKPSFFEQNNIQRSTLQRAAKPVLFGYYGEKQDTELVDFWSSSFFSTYYVYAISTASDNFFQNLSKFRFSTSFNSFDESHQNFHQANNASELYSLKKTSTTNFKDTSLPVVSTPQEERLELDKRLDSIMPTLRPLDEKVKTRSRYNSSLLFSPLRKNDIKNKRSFENEHRFYGDNSDQTPTTQDVQNLSETHLNDKMQNTKYEQVFSPIRSDQILSPDLSRIPIQGFAPWTSRVGILVTNDQGLQQNLSSEVFSPKSFLQSFSSEAFSPFHSSTTEPIENSLWRRSKRQGTARAAHFEKTRSAETFTNFPTRKEQAILTLFSHTFNFLRIGTTNNIEPKTKFAGASSESEILLESLPKQAAQAVYSPLYSVIPILNSQNSSKIQRISQKTGLLTYKNQILYTKKSFLIRMLKYFSLTSPRLYDEGGKTDNLHLIHKVNYSVENFENNSSNQFNEEPYFQNDLSFIQNEENDKKNKGRIVPFASFRPRVQKEWQMSNQKNPSAQISLINDLESEYVQIDIWTNGSLSPRQSLLNAFKKLFEIFYDLSKYDSIKPIEI